MGSVEGTNIITEISNIKAKQVSAGGEHTVIIDLRGSKRASDNKDGQLGLGDRIETNTFTKVPNIKAKQVSAEHKSTIYNK